jgi:hypothetical protein
VQNPYNRRYVRLLLVVACTAACRLHFDDVAGGTGSDGGGPAAFVPEWKSGTRFRARLLEASEGGDPIFEGWRDTKLDTDCQNTTAADGEERCLPVHVDAQTYFADAACTERIAVHYRATCGHDRFAMTTDPQDRHHVFALGAPVTGTIYDGRVGCSSLSLPAEWTAFRVAATEETPTEFAMVNYSNVQVGKHEHIQYTLGDGSSLELAAIAGTTASCIPQGGTLGPAGCRPSGLVSATPIYRDSACTQRAYLGDKAGETQLVVDDVAMCGTSYRVVDVTGDVTAATYWTRTTAGCIANSTPPGGVLYTGNEIVDPYPRGTVAPGARHGRLGRLYWTGEDDGVAFSIATYDHDLHRPCFQFIAADGVFRCLSRRPKLVDAYEDAACGGALHSLGAACYGEPPLDGPFYPTCDDQPWDVVNMPAAPVATRVDEGTCTTLPAPGGAFEHGTGTSTVAPSTFPELVERIE